jgi:hypothetical protein
MYEGTKKPFQSEGEFEYLQEEDIEYVLLILKGNSISWIEKRHTFLIL